MFLFRKEQNTSRSAVLFELPISHFFISISPIFDNNNTMKTRRRNLLIFFITVAVVLVIAATYFIIEGNKRKNQESSKNLRSPGLRPFTVAPTPKIATIGPSQQNQTIPTNKPTIHPTTRIPTLVPSSAPTPALPTLRPTLPPIPSDFAFTLKIYWEEGYVHF
jgi:hypothetical protein